MQFSLNTLIALLIFVLAGCTDKAVSPVKSSIEGSWEEHYTLKYPGMIDPGPEYIDVPMISHLTFDRGSFQINTYVGVVSEQTQRGDYSGIYSVLADTISLYSIHENDTSHAYKFNCRLYGDSLWLAEAPEITDDGYWITSMVALPWLNGSEWYLLRGANKNSGTFYRFD